MPKKLKKQKKPKKWKPKKDKVVGYVLLIVGLILILLPVYWAVSAFKSGSSPVPISIMENQISIQGGNENMVVKGISGEGINKTVGLGLWWMAMFLVIIGGGKIADLGIKMIREIKVEVKVKE